MGVCVPEEQGGAGADFLSYVLVLEELSRADAGVGVTVAVHTSACTLPLLAHGSGARRRRSPSRRGDRRVRADRGRLGLRRERDAHRATPTAGSPAPSSGSPTARTPRRSSSSPATASASARSSCAPAPTASRSPARRRSWASTPPRPPTSPSRTRRPSGSASPARAWRSRCARSTAAGSGSPPRRSGSRRPRSTWRPATPRSATRSAARSPGSARSSRSSPTCRPRSRRPARSTWRAARLKEAGHPHTVEGAQAKLFASARRAPPDRRGDPDPRRLRLHEGVPRRALLPRREGHRDLRGHERDPAARDRPRAARRGRPRRLDCGHGTRPSTPLEAEEEATGPHRARRPVHDALGGADPGAVHGGRSAGGVRGEIGLPGEFPFTRGVYPSMYRGRLWTMRQFAGFGTAEETNERFRYLLDHGQTGLSTAFDMPSLMGHDSDHPRVAGRGRARGRRGRHARRHGDAVRGDRPRRGQRVDDDQRAGGDHDGLLRRRGGGEGHPGRSPERHDPGRHPQGVHRPEGVVLPGRSGDAPARRHDAVVARGTCRAGIRSRSAATTSARRARRPRRSSRSRSRTG